MHSTANITESNRAAAAAGRPSVVGLRFGGALSEGAFWLAHTIFWAAVFGVLMTVIHVFRPAIVDPLAFVLVRVVLCFVATAAMRWLSRQESLLVRLGVSKIGVMAGGAILSAVLITLVLFAIDRSAGRTGLGPTRLELVARLAINLGLLANWCALYFGYQLIRERNSTEFRALQAESALLRTHGCKAPFDRALQ